MNKPRNKVNHRETVAVDKKDINTLKEVLDDIVSGSYEGDVFDQWDDLKQTIKWFCDKYKDLC